MVTWYFLKGMIDMKCNHDSTRGQLRILRGSQNRALINYQPPLDWLSSDYWLSVNQYIDWISTNIWNNISNGISKSIACFSINSLLILGKYYQWSSAKVSVRYQWSIGDKLKAMLADMHLNCYTVLYRVWTNLLVPIEKTYQSTIDRLSSDKSTNIWVRTTYSKHDPF